MQFSARRQRLLDQLGDGLLVLPTAAHPLRNGDVHYAFRPGSDLYYLTGFAEPDTVLVAARRGKSHYAALFVPPRDKEREIWDGPRAGVRGAVRQFGVDAAYPIGELWEKLPELLGDHDTVFHTLGENDAFDRRLMAAFRSRALARRRANPSAHPVLRDPRPVIAAMRQFKDEDEIACLEEAARITVSGHLRAMAEARPGMHEYEVQSILESEFRAAGSRRNGYESIVASGPNACVLHYVQNDRKLGRNDLLLVDAGAEFDQYTADITRTFPVSGSFTEPQRAIYEAVLKAQKAAIRAVKPGNPWDAPHKTCLRVLTRELQAQKILRGSYKNLMKKAAVRAFFMHGTSHWLGMDVHDVGTYEDADGKPIRFAPGMVLTVEPGLYFDRRDRSVPPAFRGIGVRIEDDVLVTRGGNRVLTAGVPKEVRDVEAACSAGALVER